MAQLKNARNYMNPLGRPTRLNGQITTTILVLGSLAFLSPASAQHIRYESAFNAPGYVTPVGGYDGQWQSYIELIKTRLSQHWAPPPLFNDYHTVISLNLDNNGAVSDVKVTKSSNHEMIDQIALQAVLFSKPFPPFPAENLSGTRTFQFELGRGTPLAQGENLFGTYIRLLQRRIRQYWLPPREYRSRQTIVTFQIRRDGSIDDLKIVRSNASKKGQEAALKAVNDAAPFSPLPDAFQKEQVPVQFTFDYEIHPMEHTVWK